MSDSDDGSERVAVVMPKDGWDVVSMGLEEEMAQLKPEGNWLGSAPGENDAVAIGDVYNVIMQAITDGGVVQGQFEYLLIDECGECGEEIKSVRSFDDPVLLDQGIECDYRYCPFCGNRLFLDSFLDRQAKYEVARVIPTQEQPALGSDSDE